MTLPLEAKRPLGLTREERFTRCFDVYPFEPAGAPTQTMGGTAGGPPAGMATGSVYGFGSAALRFQNEVYDSHLTYGKVNKCVIELNPPEPVNMDTLAENAPSRMLPEFAAFFSPELGCNFQRGVNRDAPPGPDGKERFWVQPKETGGAFPAPEPPEVFSMQAPRGTGKPSQMHEVPQFMMTPAERREALVFDKCHERARKELRKAANEACQLTRVMQKRYPTGVMGLEGPNCPDSIIYRIPHEANVQIERVRAQHAAGRHENLRVKRDTQLHYNFLHHDPYTVDQDKMFPRKAPTGAANSSFAGVGAGVHSASDMRLQHYEMRPLASTVDGGFRSNQEKMLVEGGNAARARWLHSASSGGKPFDIISGVSTTIVPDRAPASAYPIDRRSHPSNMSMPKATGTNATLIGPIPDAHRSEWKPSSPTRSPSGDYMR